MLQAGTETGIRGIREALWKRWHLSQGLKGQQDSKDAGDISKRLTADILTLSPGTGFLLCLPTLYTQHPDGGGHGLPFSSPAWEASLTRGTAQIQNGRSPPAPDL